MPHKFGEYEIVRVKNQGSLPPAAVRGWNETGEVYEVRLPDGQMLHSPEADLETTGQFETPFRFFEVVEIHPLNFDIEPSAIALSGQRGIITGIGSNDQSGDWSFGVAIQNGEGWYLEENELRSTGIFLSEEQVLGREGDRVTVRLRFNPKTGQETVVSGDASLLRRGPVPLSIDLSKL